MESKKLGDFLWLANGLVLLVILNLLSSHFFFRYDITEDQRYSVKPQTEALLESLDDELLVEVYLEGELNASFRRFQKAIRETLEEFRVRSGNKIRYTFIDPSAALSQKARNEFIQQLAQRGLVPTRVVERENTQTSERLIVPGAIISYGGAETGVNLLKGNKAQTQEEEINQSIEGIEYELTQGLYRLVNTDRKRIGLLQGHGELDSMQLASFNNALLELYDVYKVNLSAKQQLPDYEVIIMAKPTQRFSDQDKFKLDQYLMRGGHLLVLMDKLEAHMDSASRESYLAFPYELNLEDQLFRYGVRINLDLLQDRSAGFYPVVTGQSGGKPQLQLMDWPFFPLINTFAEHPATRNLDAVLLKFASSVDTVKATGIRKTPLLFTSGYSRKVGAPVDVSINQLRRNVSPDQFNQQRIPVGYLLEGKFTSVFKNRFLPEQAGGAEFIAEGNEAKLVVIADGDLARNDINPRTGNPQQLGFDPFSGYTFANQELLMNLVAYLADENGLINTRNKEVKIRLLDKEKIRTEKTYWQIINLVIPLVVILAYGMLRLYVRKQKYAK